MNISEADRRANIQHFQEKLTCIMTNQSSHYLKGRGAQINPANPYHKLVYDIEPVDWSLEDAEGSIPTQYIETHPKTILNKVDSPDIPSDYSMNPYQGCEHGCVYCYARNTHPYWGYSAGLDFEQKIMVKKNAAQLLETKFRSRNWKASSVMFSGNTDCYQPVERELEITRSCLEIFWKYRHPVGLITKNSLILRDLDILKKLAAQRLVHVAISVTTLDENLRLMLEPRTATIAQRINTIKTLSENGIPVTVMMAPIIPSLNDHEIFSLAEKVSEAGASALYYTLVRLNGDVATIFKDWAEKNIPDRAAKVLNKISACHGGKVGDSRFGKRMSGEGNYSKIISKQFKVARQKYFEGRKVPPYDLTLFERFRNPQMKLF